MQQKQKSIKQERMKKMQSKTVTRYYNFEIRAKNDEAHGDYIEGRPIVYGSKTDIGGMFEEVIEPGALDGADLRDVRLLVNHDTTMIPLARSRRNNKNSTMQLTVDDKGLKIRANIDTEKNSDAKNAYSAVERGDMDGMSFLFVVEKDRWEDLDSDYPKRHIEKISSVMEVSIVTFPAYEDTEVTARAKEALENAKGALENAKARSADADNAELELEKLKAKYLYGGN